MLQLLHLFSVLSRLWVWKEQPPYDDATFTSACRGGGEFSEVTSCLSHMTVT